MEVELSASLQNQIFALLEAGHPNEAGGFLLGEPGEKIIIRDVIPITNTFASEEQWHRYAMTPQDWARLEDEADERGLTLVGYYHSHPDSPAIPSIFDRDHALPNFVYIITAVYNAKHAEQRAWWLRDDRTQFDEGTLTVRP